MGLFRRKARQPTRRAQAKALRHKAGLEAKYSARNQRRRDRAEQRATDRVAKAKIATLKAQERAAVKAVEKADRDRFGVSQVKKYLGVARVLAPVLVPLAYRAATFARAQLDARRARDLGVGVGQLADFTGHGAKLSARIANAESSTNEILGRSPNDATTKAFAADTQERLANLNAAVRTSEQMPAEQRRTAHTAIASELTSIESDLLDQLGVRGR